MADGYYLSRDAWSVLQRMMADYKAGRMTNRPPRDETNRVRGGTGFRLAITSTEHAPDATEEVSLRKADWSYTGKTLDAVNDSAVTIPEDTRIYVAKIAGKWRIVWAAICEDE